MQSITSRTNAVFAQGTTVGLLLVLLVALSSLVMPVKLEPAHLALNKVNVMVGRSPQGKPQDYLFTTMTVSADLRPVFHYNTKQIVVQVVADFQTDTYPENAVVLWDRIIRKKSNAKINVEGIRNKYTFKSLERLTGTNMTLGLQYHVQPYVGLLKSGEAGRSAPIAIPPPQQQVQ